MFQQSNPLLCWLGMLADELQSHTNFDYDQM